MNEDMIALVRGIAGEWLEDYFRCTGETDELPEPFRRYIDWPQMAADMLCDGTLLLDDAGDFWFRSK